MNRTCSRISPLSLLLASRSQFTGVRHPVSTRLYSSHHHHHWDHIEPVALDAIKQLTIAFHSDPNTDKILLGEGVYRDNDGKPFVLPSVREAEKRIFEAHMDHEYAPVSGVPEFVSAAREFLFGANSDAVKQGRVCIAKFCLSQEKKG